VTECPFQDAEKIGRILFNFSGLSRFFLSDNRCEENILRALLKLRMRNGLSVWWFCKVYSDKPLRIFLGRAEIWNEVHFPAPIAAK
jgi:hypothetical protein